MSLIKSVIFIQAILILLIWLGIPFYLLANHYELTPPYEEAYTTSRIYLVPFAVMLLLLKIVKRRDDAEAEGCKVGCTSLVAIGFMIGFALARLEPCGDIIGNPLYIKKDNPNVTINIRRYRCKESNGFPVEEVIRIEKISPIIDRVTDIDTTGLDRRAWIPIAQLP